MLTPETIQGGQDAVPDYGCKMPPTRLVLPPWFPNWPLTNRASWNGATRSTGYEFAGHDRPEQRGTALAWNQEIPIKTAPILPIDNSHTSPAMTWRGTWFNLGGTCCSVVTLTDGSDPWGVIPGLRAQMTRIWNQVLEPQHQPVHRGKPCRRERFRRAP
jgi:hypothetical protein